MPISAKSVVQTGPNTYAGGLMGDFTIPAYQPAIEGVVNTESMTPASSEIMIVIMSLSVLLIFVVIF